MAKNVLITGANRGIGLEYVKQYLAQDAQVWACYRQQAGELDKLRDDRLTLLQWDVSNPLKPSEQKKLPDELHLLINNAGVYGEYGAGQTLEEVDQAQMLSVFAVNAAAPITVVQQLLPKLNEGATVANMSSKMGSSADNTSGGAYAYRASKAALCIISKSMAVDLGNKNIKVIALHPGYVQTDMTHQNGNIDVETSVQGLIDIIADIDQFPAGALVSYAGEVIPY